MQLRGSLCLFLLMVITTSCNKNDEIFRQLDSKEPNEIIEGTYKAGESREMIFVPLLLKNADKPWAATYLQFKGFTVYTETMFALQKILHVNPPHKFGGILEEPNYENIRFYKTYWQKIHH